jgi:hypothetical protein
MTRGIRLTTGAEFALRDAAPSPVQLAKVEPMARALLPLGERVEQLVCLLDRNAARDHVPERHRVLQESRHHEAAPLAVRLRWPLGHEAHRLDDGEAQLLERAQQLRRRPEHYRRHYPFSSDDHDLRGQG